MKAKVISNNRRRKSSPVVPATFQGTGISLSSSGVDFDENPIGMEFEVGDGEFSSRSRFVVVMSFAEAEKMQKALADHIAFRKAQFARGVFGRKAERGEALQAAAEDSDKPLPRHPLAGLVPALEKK